jgi:hypothetical protein
MLYFAGSSSALFILHPLSATRASVRIPLAAREVFIFLVIS